MAVTLTKEQRRAKIQELMELSGHHSQLICQKYLNKKNWIVQKAYELMKEEGVAKK